MKNPILNKKLPAPSEVNQAPAKRRPLSAKARKKQRALEKQFKQIELAMKRKERVNEMMHNGEMLYFSNVHQSAHILMTALQMVFEELEAVLHRNDIHIDHFKTRFDRILTANDDFYELMNKLSDKNDTRVWSVQMDKFMHLFSSLIGFNPFGIDLINIELTPETVMNQYMSIEYNRLRLKQPENFTLKSFKEQAREKKLPNIPAVVKELRAQGYIVSAGRQFTFVQKPIPIEFFENLNINPTK